MRACAKPPQSDSRSALPPGRTRIDAARCDERSGRWYTNATSDSQRPRCRTTAALASPRQSRQSVAPPIRKDFAPTSSAGMPAATATRPASALTSAVLSGMPKRLVKNAVSSAGALRARVPRSHQSAAGRPSPSTGKGTAPTRRRHHASAMAS